MGLLEEAIGHGPKKGPVCSVALFLDALGVEERAEVVAAMSDAVVTSSGLVRAMKARGWPTPQAQVIQRHRRGECRCG